MTDDKTRSQATSEKQNATRLSHWKFQ